MFINLSFDEIRDICRKQIESFELWSRRLIHEQFYNKLGKDYINAKINNEEFIFKKELRDKADKKFRENPARYKNAVDTFLLDDILSILCREDLYRAYFKDALICFAKGAQQTRHLLKRIKDPRNSLSHANPISIREAEQILCYTNDFIESLKVFYRGEGMDQEYNVPQIIKMRDSTGYEAYRNSFINADSVVFLNFTKDLNHIFRPGDEYRIEVEVDPSFSSDSYNIKWSTSNAAEIKEYQNKKFFAIKFKDENVSTQYTITCRIISKKTWHKHVRYDDRFFVTIKVLPLIE